MAETIHNLFKRHLSKRPNAPAFLIAAGDRSLPITWRQFGRDIDALAWAGLKHVGRGARVGIIGENSYEWIVTHAACLMSGVVAVPLEPTLSAQEMAQRLAFGDARFVLHSVLYEDKVRDVAKLLPGVFFTSFGSAAVDYLLERGAALGVCPDFRRLFDAVQRFRATRLFLVPALAEILAHKIGNRTGRQDEMPGRIEWILTGGAPLPRRIYEQLQSFGIRMLEGYGLTETCSLYSLAPYDAPRVGTAGLVSPLPDVETKVSDDGELLIRGPNVMTGYYREPEETARVMKDGWFHTGDTGEIDKDGYVKVIGRRNRTIVLSSGKKVAPEELENLLAGLPGILEALVTGEGESRQLTAEVYSTLPEKAVHDQIDTVNRTLPIYKRIRRVVVRKEPFPRTASGKIKV